MLISSVQKTNDRAVVEPGAKETFPGKTHANEQRIQNILPSSLNSAPITRLGSAKALQSLCIQQGSIATL